MSKSLIHHETSDIAISNYVSMLFVLYEKSIPTIYSVMITEFGAVV